MNYRQLRYFVEVVQQGSIKSAAQQLGVSQPAVSAAIQNLEREFGVKLLDRRRDGSVPTIYGKALYDSAITMDSVMATARERLAALKDPSRIHLKIGTGPSVSVEHVSAAIAKLLLEYPELRITHTTNNSYTAFEQLLTIKDIDIAICHVPANRLPKSIDSRLVTDNPIGALVASGHVPEHAETLRSVLVSREFRWITPRDDAIRPPEGVSLAPRRRDSEPPISVLAEDLSLIKHLTLTTRSIGFLPLQMAEEELRAGQLVELVMDGAVVSRPVYALTRQSAEKPVALERFVEILHEVFSTATRSAGPHRVVHLTSE